MSGIALDALNNKPTSPTELQNWIGGASQVIRDLAGKVARHEERAELLDRATAMAASSHSAGLAATAHTPMPTVQAGEDDDLTVFIKKDGTIRLYDEVDSFHGVPVLYKGLLSTTESYGDYHDKLRAATMNRTVGRMVNLGRPTESVDSAVVGLILDAPRSIRSAMIKTMDERADLAKKSRSSGESGEARQRSYRQLTAGVPEEVQRQFADVAGYGAEWIPDNFSPNLLLPIEMPEAVEALFTSRPLDGPVLKIPKVTTLGRPYLIAVQGSGNDQPEPPCTEIGTSEQSISPAEIGSQFRIGMTAAEDSAIANLQQVLGQLMIRGHRTAAEDILINGSTDATHPDSIGSWNTDGRWGTTGLGGSNDHRRAFKGLRHLARGASKTSDMGSNQTVADLASRLIPVFGGKFAAMPGVVFIMGPDVYWKKFAVDSNVITVDKYGPRATILNGELGSVFGKPIVISRFMTSDLNASGFYDATTTTKAGVLVVHAPSYAMYRKTGLAMNIERTNGPRQIKFYTYERYTFGPTISDSETPVAWGYNYL